MVQRKRNQIVSDPMFVITFKWTMPPKRILPEFSAMGRERFYFSGIFHVKVGLSTFWKTIDLRPMLRLVQSCFIFSKLETFLRVRVSKSISIFEKAFLNTIFRKGYQIYKKDLSIIQFDSCIVLIFLFRKSKTEN